MKIPVLFASMAILGSCAMMSNAADLIIDAEAQPQQCALAQDSSLNLTTSMLELRQAIRERMDHAVATAKNPEWIASSRPVFVWANETKAVCGIVLGYLKAGYQDQGTVSQCDCFHARMVSYMN